MFGFGILTYIKLGLAAVVLIVLSYLVWNYHHMQIKIEAQRIEIANLRLEQTVLADKQKAFDEFMTKWSRIKKQVAKDEAKIDEAVDSGNDGRIIEQFNPYRVRPDGQVQPTPDGRKGGIKPPSGRPAHPGLN